MSFLFLPSKAFKRREEASLMRLGFTGRVVYPLRLRVPEGRIVSPPQTGAR